MPENNIEKLETEARQLFQKFSNFQKCWFNPKMKATETHHIINKAQCELLRYDYRNAYPINHQNHNQSSNSSIEHCNEWNIPHIPMSQRYYLNTYKNILLKDYLRMTGQTKEEFLIEKIEELKKQIKINKLLAFAK